MTALALTLQVAWLNLGVWRYLARRATLRLMRRVLKWMEPAGWTIFRTVRIVEPSASRPGVFRRALSDGLGREGE